ncbi:MULTISPECIES: TetR/AcrR family transcriptional regulator [unclassified Sphingopyxis]|jgi:AcrR family transcriptional regulator|uniref:TetR/AcrR family transcriptional regulator n=1 Tax=unclassified Sphingopyxis TaxID=2614943 RepID=UPI0025E8B96B|nr:MULTISPECIES: TetR family transcriptional regulator [unclassified Sphingopyxis]HEV7341161.1 TetR family transcriptional regulator [Sphingopyxis sp.]
MSIVKKRLSPEESRFVALQAAREILIETGPAAVTLKAVAGRIDRTHANLLHHFGSAAGLQKALAAYLAETVCATIGEKMAASPPGERNVREIVDLAFDAFDSGGAGALATWMAATGNEDALDPIVEAIHKLIDGMAPDAHEKRLMHEDTLALVLMALGDAQLGGAMAEALGLPRDTARALACELITGRIANFWAQNTK